MNAEDFAVNNGTKDEEIKDLAASFPDRGIAVFLLALLVETVDLGNLARFVIATDECNTIRIS